MQDNFSYSKKEKGFTMVEVIVAIFILAFAILGSYYAFSQMAGLTTIISSRLTAAYLAQEGIELVRSVRDTNWLNGLAWSSQINSCSSGCEIDYNLDSVMVYSDRFLNVDNSNFYSYSVGTPTKFKRRITITTPAADTLGVSVQIQWQEKGSSYTFSAEEYLYNWR